MGRWPLGKQRVAAASLVGPLVALGLGASSLGRLLIRSARAVTEYFDRVVLVVR